MTMGVYDYAYCNTDSLYCMMAMKSSGCPPNLSQAPVSVALAATNESCACGGMATLTPRQSVSNGLK